MIQFHHIFQGFQSSLLKSQLIDNQLLIKKVETPFEVSTFFKKIKSAIENRKIRNQIKPIKARLQ
jgi:hypothetical protein